MLPLKGLGKDVLQASLLASGSFSRPWLVDSYLLPVSLYINESREGNERWSDSR